MIVSTYLRKPGHFPERVSWLAVFRAYQTSLVSGLAFSAAGSQGTSRIFESRTDHLIKTTDNLITIYGWSVDSITQPQHIRHALLPPFHNPPSWIIFPLSPSDETCPLKSLTFSNWMKEDGFSCVRRIVSFTTTWTCCPVIGHVTVEHAGTSSLLTCTRIYYIAAIYDTPRNPCHM